MKDSNAQTTLASALRAAGIGEVSGNGDETSALGTTDPNGLHGSLRSAFAAAMAALPQASSLPAPDAVDIGYAKPMAMSEITDGWGNAVPELFQQDGDDGQPVVVDAKPWRVEEGSDAVAAAAQALSVNVDLAAVLTATVAGIGGNGSLSLTGSTQEAARMGGGTAALEISAQQLVQAMAGFAPQAAGESLMASGAFRDALGVVAVNPLG
ncbi:hypothetical protein [Xanthomonas phaseoli]|uniref:hypothetical protein n=1 Tax=Xanthomonas phaseoli TaxID=1985254 RepID=UPI001238177F|nr:hypothetical protein [Xanthomonas phaseoli]MBO9831189.1 hypothetical protein [Xanthomonas phaseoli pv. dieffenbachiae]MBO9837524.1 hypothetical protein [Xanthomonas phaseoli pv. dieffenbachiae]MBO9839236.1 hypothetical protein [Xanthomonas phaseoli pv. dieffenbachiae]MBO9861159.1 hypothetical protein [Xanthomonas phaseoli pv. dieffenbachiae]MBO9865035.1 hypothetical protein [Xanthomonas phaseoli pv. dieffenbachiae]